MKQRIGIQQFQLDLIKRETASLIKLDSPSKKAKKEKEGDPSGEMNIMLYIKKFKEMILEPGSSDEILVVLS